MKRYSTGESFGRIIITFVGCLIMIPITDSMELPWSLIPICLISAVIIFYPKIFEFINDRIENHSQKKDNDDYDE